MNRSGFARLTAVAAGCMLLSAASGLTRAQGAPSSATPTAHRAGSPAAAHTGTPTDDFAGLKLTEDQSARIEEIRANIKTHRDAVLKDDKLIPEQRTAMLQGLQRMENGEIYSKVLTRAQQAEVRKKVLARRAAAQQEQMKKLQAGQPK